MDNLAAEIRNSLQEIVSPHIPEIVTVMTGFMLGLVLSFKMFFADRDGFLESIKFWLLPSHWVLGADVWHELKLIWWLVCGACFGYGAYKLYIFFQCLNVIGDRPCRHQIWVCSRLERRAKTNNILATITRVEHTHATNCGVVCVSSKYPTKGASTPRIPVRAVCTLI